MKFKGKVFDDKMTSRIVWIDYVKCLCITLMVLCHVGLKGLPHQFIYAFHMPLFFMVSGYLYKPRNWVTTLKCYLVPIVLISIVRLAYILMTNYFKDGSVHFSESFCVEQLYRTHTGHPALFTGQWFVMSLMINRFFLGDIKFIGNYVNKYYKILYVILLLWLIIQNHVVGSCIFQYYYIYLSIAAFPFMCVGKFLKKQNLKRCEMGGGGLACLIIIFIVIAYYNGEVDMSINKYGKNYLLFHLGSVAAFFIFMRIFQSLDRNYIVETYSQGTLLILGTHKFIYTILIDAFKIIRYLCHS